MSKKSYTDESLTEAERLAQLPVAVQRQAIALIRAPARDPKASKADRAEARRRATSLKRQLRRLSKAKKKK